MPSLSLVVLLSVVIFATFLLVCFANAPIIWPDPRLLKATIVQNGENELDIEWPILEYLKPDSYVSARFTVRKVGDEKYWETVERWKFRDFTLDEWNTEYIITYQMVTDFFPQGVSADIRVKSGAPPRIGERDSVYIPKLTQIKVRGNETRIIVLREISTKKCLLIIYDQSVKDENYTIETTGECINNDSSALAVSIPMKSKPSNTLDGLQLIELDIKSDVLREFRDFSVVNYTVFDKMSSEVDPPLDIYGKLEIISPVKCILTITYRPPASNPKLIKNFTFSITPKGEKRVFTVIEDDAVATLNSKFGFPTSPLYVQAFALVWFSKQIFQSSGDSHILFSEVVKAQSDRNKPLSFVSETITTFPGNFTLVAFTNNAQVKMATHPIIMPDLSLSVPVDPKIQVENMDVFINWYKPTYFGDFCKYTVEAISRKENFSQRTETMNEISSYTTISVKFSNLTLGMNFAFYIETQCKGSRIQRIKVGEMETNPGTPGVPQDPQLILLDQKTVNFTWNPPAVFRGRKRIYEWLCSTEDDRRMIDGTVEENHVLIENFSAGKFFCIVKAISCTPGHRNMHGDTPLPQPIKIIEINETTVELDLMGEHRRNVIGYSVVIDSDLKIRFYTDQESEVEITGDSKTDVKRTGQGSLILHNLTPHQTYKVNVTTFYVSYTSSNLYTVKPVPKGL
ncbi:hypothetical protein ACTXT7_009658 [Hymenolepis weldensis]